jgi:uncharacterized membrane protein YdjX (TVP38/TMEM64 family)
MTAVGRWAGLAAALGALGAMSWWSYGSGGFVFALAQTTTSGSDSLAVLRDYLATWGTLAPAVYVLFVIVEVLVAPIPGTLLYAPGGAIFGGFLGGSLSLAGNVIGAGVACLIARFWEQPVTRSLDSVRMRSIQNAVAARGLWLILLLRINPLTSSDLVSYAAGLVGIRIWKVMVGTLLGMAPLCYAQAYLADRLFRVLPWSGWAIVALGMAYAAVVVWIVVRRPPQDPINY